MRLEFTEFKTRKEFSEALTSAIEGKEVFREYKDSNGNIQKKKIISNNRIYFNNNFSLNVREGENKKIYMSIDYFDIDSRLKVSKNSSEVETINL